MKGKKNKRKARGWIVAAVTAAVIIAAVIAAAVYVYVRQPKASPEQTVAQYFSYLSQKNYKGMYELIDAQSKINISEEKFIERNQAIYEGIGAENIEVVPSEADENIVRFTMSMTTTAGDMSFANKAKLTKEGGLWYIDWDDSLIFPELTADDKVRVETVTASRGALYDRNGNMLAGEGTVYDVGLVPGKFDTADLEKLSALLGMTQTDIEVKLSASWVTDDTFVPVKQYKDGAISEELKTSLLSISGVMINSGTDRVYPYGAAASHLTGYVQGISAEELEEKEGEGYTQTSVIGKSGLEKLYEDRLHGTDGCEIYIVVSAGNHKTMLAVTPVQNGEDIWLTIDMNIQQAYYEQYKEDKSASVVINPITGEVLALVSTPSFDSNDFITGLSQEAWDALNNDEAKPMYNRFRASFVPGSSFKPVVGALGMTSGSFTADEDFGTSGLAWQKDESWGSYAVTTLHAYSGAANLRNALVYSDNIYFAKAALRMGADTLMQGLDSLGFNEAMPFELGMTASQYANEGSVIDDEIQLADSGYGQGQVLVNPLHMASIYSAFLNGGNMIAPYLEYKEDAAPSVWKTGVFSAEAAEIVKQDLVQVIEDAGGTGHGAYTEGQSLAGKTGTAEIKGSQDDTTGTELGWFVVFPTDAGTDEAWLSVTMAEDVAGRGQSAYVVNKTRALIDTVFSS